MLEASLGPGGTSDERSVDELEVNDGVGGGGGG